MRLGAVHYMAFAICLYTGIAWFSLDKPLTLDQAIPTAWNAGAIAHYGWDALGSTERYYEISHPVLHQHLLSINYAILGETTIAARLLGVICFIGTLFLIVRLSQIVYPGENGVRIGGLSAFLYALNPFIVQYSLLVDQETTILPVFLLLFFCYFFRQDFKFTRLAVAKLSGLFALCLWGKEFTPYFMLVALVPFLWLRCGGFKYAFLTALQIGLLGTVIFAATWTLYSLFSGVPLLSFVEFSIVDKALNPAFHQGRSITRLLRGLAWAIGMVTPAALALLAFGAFYRIRQFYKSGFEVRPTDYLWLYTALFWVITNLHIQGPRYQYPLYSVAVILIAEYLYRILGKVTRAQVIFAVGVGVACAVGFALLIEDDPILLPPAQYILFAVIVPLVFCFLLLLGLKTLPVLTRSRLILTMLSFLVATNLSLSIKQTAPHTTAASWGEYGEKGFNDTLAYLKAHVDGSVPLVRKDLGYYLTIEQPDRQFRYIYNNLFRGNLDDPVRISQIQEIILRDDVQYIVLDRYTNRTQTPSLIRPFFTLIHTFGDFEIYRKPLEVSSSK